MSEKKIAVITGATKGLGRCLAEQAVRSGYAVVGTYHHDEAAADELRKFAVAGSLPLTLLRHDIASTDEMQQVVAAVLAAHPQEILLIHNACAAFKPTPFHLTAPDEFQRQIQTGYVGPAALTQALLRPMIKTGKGTIVTVLSAALRPDPPPGFSAYLG